MGLKINCTKVQMHIDVLKIAPNLTVSICFKDNGYKVTNHMNEGEG